MLRVGPRHTFQRMQRNIICTYIVFLGRTLCSVVMLKYNPASSDLRGIFCSVVTMRHHPVVSDISEILCYVCLVDQVECSQEVEDELRQHGFD